MVGHRRIPHRTVHKVNKELTHSTATCMAKTISSALRDKSIHTHRVCSSQPIANETAGPLNKRGCIEAGLPTNDNRTEYL